MSWVYVGILETSLITLVERISQRDLASQASKDRDVKKKKWGKGGGLQWQGADTSGARLFHKFQEVGDPTGDFCITFRFKFLTSKPESSQPILTCLKCGASRASGFA